MVRTVDFLNLASGLAWLGDPRGPTDFRAVRIQSTACEQKRWSFVIEDLDHEFLIRAARGDLCRLWDASSRKLVSRAVYQGLPWIRYAMERRWLDATSPVLVRGHNVETYFDRCYRQLSRRAVGKLDYAGKFLATPAVHIEGVCKRTSLDGKYAELSAMLAG
jgi:hypothetical protein